MARSSALHPEAGDTSAVRTVAATPEEDPLDTHSPTYPLDLGVQIRLVGLRALQECPELLDVESGLPDENPERALGQRAVIGDD